VTKQVSGMHIWLYVLNHKGDLADGLNNLSVF